MIVNKYKYSFYNILVSKSKNFVLLHNSSTGAFCKLERKVFELIKDNNDIDANIEYFDLLKQQGFIVEQILDEYNKIISKETEMLNTSYPTLISDVLALTLNCNMNCVYCFEDNRKNANCGLSWQITYDIVEYIKKRISVPSVKKYTLSWFGGEPLLEYDKIIYIGKAIKEFCESKHIVFESSIVTNGLLLKQDKTKEMIDKCNLKRVQITLDGTREVYCELKRVKPKVFDEVIDNICDSCGLIPIVIRLNSNKTNIEDLENLIEYLYVDKKLKGKIKLYLAEIKNYNGYVQCETFTSSEFEKLRNSFYEKLEKKYHVDFTNLISNIRVRTTTCGCIKKANNIIGPKGEIYKCEHYIGDNNQIVGDIYNGYYYNKQFFDFSSAYHFTKCKKCKLFPICLSGCRNHQIIFKNKAVNCRSKLNSLKIYLKRIYNKKQK